MLRARKKNFAVVIDGVKDALGAKESTVAAAAAVAFIRSVVTLPPYEPSVTGVSAEMMQATTIEGGSCV